MQADIDMLRRQRSDLEDEELEVMEQREALDAELAALDAAIAAVAGDVDAAARTRSPTPRPRSTRRSPEDARARRAGRRSAEALLRDYERRRAQNRGAGAARLVGTTCQACHLIDPVDGGRADPARRRRPWSRTATTAARSSCRDAAVAVRRRRRATARRGRHLLRRRLARESRAVGDRRGRARPVDRSAAARSRR